MERIAEATLLRRTAAARALLGPRDLDALVLYSAPRRLGGGTQTSGNVQYFTGWTPLGGGCVLVIPPGGMPIVLTGGPNEARVFAQRIGSFVEVRRPSPKHSFAATVRDVVAAGGARRLGVVGAAEMPAALHAALSEACDLIPIDAAIHGLRLVRDPDEVALHRKAAGISDRMVQGAMALAAVPGMTPAQIMTETEYTGRRLGADMASIWLAIGPAPPVTCFELFELPARVAPGDRVQLGTTLSLEGHFAQTLRMGVRGTPSRALRDVADVLLDIQDRTLAALVVGRPVHTIVDTIEALIDGHCPFTRATDPFRFQSCHGLGLDYAEPALSVPLSPDRSRADDADGPLIAENMVFEIHPNFTVPGLGHVCAGDMAVATPRGGAWLTQAPRGLAVID